MLPGFRFLFAAIMLSMSLLVFGLGAAALLRAAHESFASNSSWRAAPEVPFAQRPDTTPPVLATLRVEPNAIESANEPANVNTASTESGGSEQAAALRPAETPPAENAKSDTPVSVPAAENRPAPATESVKAALPTGETPPAADEQKTTAVAAIDVPPANNQPVAAQAEPAVLPPETTSAASTDAPEASIAATKIATLGGPPVDVAGTATAPPTRMVKSDRAKPERTTIRKHVQAKHTTHRRRFTARTRLLAQQQLQANPFAQQQAFTPATSRQ